MYSCLSGMERGGGVVLCRAVSRMLQDISPDFESCLAIAFMLARAPVYTCDCFGPQVLCSVSLMAYVVFLKSQGRNTAFVFAQNPPQPPGLNTALGNFGCRLRFLGGRAGLCMLWPCLTYGNWGRFGFLIKAGGAYDTCTGMMAVTCVVP